MQLDLSSLSTPELRQLLDSARSRGHAAQSYRILQEMEARRAAEPAPRKSKRRPDEPRVIDLDLGDPLEPRDVTEDFDLPPMPASDLALDPADDPIAGLTLAREADPPPAPRPALDPARKARPRIAVFAIGATLGVVAGWAGATATAGDTRLALTQLGLPRFAMPALAMPDFAAFVGSSKPAAEPSADVEVAEAPPAPTGEAAPPPVLEVAVAPADALTLAEDASAHAPLPEAAPDLAPAATIPPPPPPVEEPPACAESIPADRAICEDPSLQKLQRDLRQAYAKALDAHADRATLRQRQLAWRDARDPIDDPAKLAALYEARIRKLNTATAEARRLAER